MLTEDLLHKALTKRSLHNFIMALFYIEVAVLVVRVGIGRGHGWSLAAELVAKLLSGATRIPYSLKLKATVYVPTRVSRALSISVANVACFVP